MRVRFIPVNYILTYNYYTYDTDFLNKRVDHSVVTPELEVRSRLWDALITLGWRF